MLLPVFCANCGLCVSKQVLLLGGSILNRAQCLAADPKHFAMFSICLSLKCILVIFCCCKGNIKQKQVNYTISCFLLMVHVSIPALVSAVHNRQHSPSASSTLLLFFKTLEVKLSQMDGLSNSKPGLRFGKFLSGSRHRKIFIRFRHRKIFIRFRHRSRTSKNLTPTQSGSKFLTPGEVFIN